MDAKQWFTKRTTERDALLTRNRQIEAEADNLFESLWKYITEIIDQAKDFNLATNGSHHSRVIRKSAPPVKGEGVWPAKETRVKLEAAKHLISISGEVNKTFHLSLRERDGIVCLVDAERHEVSLQEAAIQIMDPILFPELQKKTL